MAKLNWKILKDDKTPWVGMIKTKYFKNRSPHLQQIKSSNPSVVARNISKGWPLFKQGLRFVIADGKNTPLWTENWTGLGALRELFNGPLTLEGCNSMVNSIIECKKWNLNKLSFPCCKFIQNIILAIPMSLYSSGQDSIAWRATTDGTFSLKSAYELITPTNSSLDINLLWLWNLNTLPKIKTFAWLCCLDKLSTKVNLKKRNIIFDDLCDSCFMPEHTRHLLWECPRSLYFWSKLGFTPNPLHPDLSISHWFKTNSSSSSTINGIPSFHLFLFGCHTIWTWRNCRLFNPNRPLFPEVECVNRVKEFHYRGPVLQEPRLKQVRKVDWIPPPIGYFKLNTDGASKGNPGLAGGGGLIRNHLGQCIKGFSRKIGLGNSIVAELWALRDGLRLAFDLNCVPLCVEIDATSIISLLSSDTQDHPLNTVLNDCGWLLSRLQVDGVAHIYREGIKPADALANMGCHLSINVFTFDVPPIEVDNLISMDCNRVGNCNLNSSV